MVADENRPQVTQRYPLFLTLIYFNDILLHNRYQLIQQFEP
jgi:hypothetical protein